MNESSLPQSIHIDWPKTLEIGLFSLLILVALLLLLRCFFYPRHSATTPAETTNRSSVNFWEKIPEVQLLMLAVPLQLLWETAQLPLYTIWHESDWGSILYALVHCTLGDLLILLLVYWLVSIFHRSRMWAYTPSITNILWFTLSGILITITSEIINTRYLGTWAYTESMPIIPVIEVGGMPFLQWLLIPPVLIWLMNLIKLARTARMI